MSKTVPAELLAAACDALGAVMHTLAGRRLLARGIKNETMRSKIAADLKTDEQLERIAADAFEAAALALAEVKYPGAAAFLCNPSEEP